MRFGIPLLGDRVAPRCTFADSVLLVSMKHRRIVDRSRVPLAGGTWADLAQVLGDGGVDALICGGISRSTRDSVEARAVDVIENVAGTADEVVEALRRGRLEPGFGLSNPRGVEAEGMAEGAAEGPAGAGEGAAVAVAVSARGRRRGGAVDCLACEARECVYGAPCPRLDPSVWEESWPPPELEAEVEKILESARDVACEEERALCRLAELVYFALDAGYERVGVAFCIELAEPAAILTRVLRRFFDVLPVCCKVGGVPLSEMRGGGGTMHESMRVACDPVGQASVLNAWQAELNVVVGLCVGVDCVFARASHAPVTTIFVKDRSLANNPIGAVYSHYHLQEI